MVERLLEIIAKSVPISKVEEDLCKKYFDDISFKKNQIIEKSGQVPQYLYFVIEGFVRVFHFNIYGSEITTQINCPNGFITSSYLNFINLVKSDESISSITDCRLLRISKTYLEQLTHESTTIKDFSIAVFQQSIAYYERRSTELATLNALQRYQNLIRSNPEIVKNVPIQIIASFLGMKPESLSRIRKSIS